MKGLFEKKKKSTGSSTAELVRSTRELLGTSLQDPRREEKMSELARNIRKIKVVLYGNSEAEPVPEACAQLTQEMLASNTMRLLIESLPKLDLEARKDTTQVVANLQRQQVQSRLIASDYLDNNRDLLDLLVSGYETPEMALHYGTMLRECIRHQSAARYILESPNLSKFFKYIELPNFEVACDAAANFRELLTRHKSTVADYLTKNYDWFFSEFNGKLLSSPNYITRRQMVKLLGEILLDRSNVNVMMRYVSSKANMCNLMNLLRDPSKSIQIEAFHVFKVFVANANKPPEIISVLVANRSKFLRFFRDFKTEKEDLQFDQDKAQVVEIITNLEVEE
jgi:calcium binding protein 39